MVTKQKIYKANISIYKMKKLTNKIPQGWKRAGSTAGRIYLIGRVLTSLTGCGGTPGHYDGEFRGLPARIPTDPERVEITLYDGPNRDHIISGEDGNLDGAINAILTYDTPIDNRLTKYANKDSLTLAFNEVSAQRDSANEARYGWFRYTGDYNGISTTVGMDWRAPFVRMTDSSGNQIRAYDINFDRIMEEVSQSRNLPANSPLQNYRNQDSLTNASQELLRRRDSTLKAKSLNLR